MSRSALHNKLEWKREIVIVVLGEKANETGMGQPKQRI
jgi:hypothetical protein